MRKNLYKIKNLIFISFLLVTLCVLFSCEANQKAFPEERIDFAYVNFEISNTRDITIEYDPADYSKLYWFYTAVKKDGYGKSGETGEKILAPVIPLTKTENNEILVAGLTTEEESVGPFSLGEWSLKLVAYRDCVTSANSGEGYTYELPYPVTTEKIENEGAYIKSNAESGKNYYLSDENMVYESKEIKVNLIDSKLTTVSASVEPKGKEGTVTFENVEFESTNSFTKFVISRTDTEEEQIKIEITLEAKNDENENEGNGINVKWDNTGTPNTEYTVSGSTKLEKGMYKCEMKYRTTGAETDAVGFSFPFAVYPNTTTNITNKSIGPSNP